jgi:hypothetical protein
VAKCRRTGVKRDATIGKTDYDVPRPEEEVDIFAQKDDAVIKTGEGNSTRSRLLTWMAVCAPSLQGNRFM